LQKLNCTVDIPALRLFVAATGEQYHAITNLRVINAVTGPDINSQLSNAVSQGLAVPKQTRLDTSNTPDDGELRYPVTQTIKPILIKIVFVRVEVVNDFVHD
jgi:hypothetical protein